LHLACNLGLTLLKQEIASERFEDAVAPWRTLEPGKGQTQFKLRG
jgi:hypothetical protein